MIKKKQKNKERYLAQFLKINLKIKKTIQVGLIFFFAIFATVNTAIRFLGDYPSIIENNLDFVKLFLNSKFNIFYEPVRQFIFYFLVIQFLIIKPIIKVLKDTKFNIILVFLIEMFFILISLFWDVIASREMEFYNIIGLSDYLPEDKDDIFYSLALFIFFLIYSYCCFFSIRNKNIKIPSKISRVLPFFQKTIDSIHFWFWRENKKTKKNKK